MRIQTNVTRRLTNAALALAAVALAACSDSASAPAAPETALRPSGPRLTVATTVVTTAALDPTVDNIYVSAEGHRLTIPANAICKVGVSGYGPSTWNLPCTTATAPIVFTIRSTTDAGGRPRITVSPDVRFAPGKTVTASFIDSAAAAKYNSLVAYCPTGSAKCIDESLTDPTLKTVTDPATGRVSRRIKHFSGYTVIVGFGDCGEYTSCGGFDVDRSASAARAAGYITTTGLDGGAREFGASTGR